MIENDNKVNKNAGADDEQTFDEVGDIRIADEVICIVASLAAQEVSGVLGMSGGFTDGLNHLMGKENSSKGVRIKFEGKLVNASVYLIVEYGACIPEIALEVQEKVKEAIEGMTGYDVQFVDVHIEGVAKRKASELERPQSPEEDMEELLRKQVKQANATESNSFEAQLANLRDENDDFELLPEDEMDERQRKFFEED